ncbi:hypothetical protein CKA32_004563 [Geitlerinema sp. FC II]|nr:hypothetical protein CKA32_004563 [Geitlerinema sp. FC II]
MNFCKLTSDREFDASKVDLENVRDRSELCCPFILAGSTSMNNPKETLPPAIEDDPVLLDPTDTDRPEEPPYLYRPTLTGNTTENDDEPVFPRLEDGQPLDEVLDGEGEHLPSALKQSSDAEDSVALESAIEDEAAVLMSGRTEELAEVASVDEDAPETLHPIF